jgi:glutamyl-tRNA reductase
MNELSATTMIDSGAAAVVVDQSASSAQELAQKLGGRAATLAERWRCLKDADIVISATGSPHVVLTREEAERIAAERNRVALLIIDLGVPRDVDPDVRRVDGVILYDLDGLERMVESEAGDRTAAIAEAETIVAREAQAFRGKLNADSGVPTVLALRHRLDEICRQELESFIEERGPFTREQDQSIHAITNQIIQKIASFLARELKELPEKEEQDQMTAAVARLFRLESPPTALAGTRLGRENNERSKEHQVAFNY